MASEKYERMKYKMKKKWIIGAVVILLAIIIIAVVLIVKHHNTQPAGNQNDSSPAGAETVSIVDDCWEHVTNMNIVDQDDGTVEVTLTAPDYVALVKLLAAENHDTPTKELFAQAVKSNSETVKEYAFTASSASEDDVKTALIEQISYELVALTLEDIIGG